MEFQMRFHSQEHLDAFFKNATYPAIHDDIIHTLKAYARPGQVTIDLGSCVGLLSHRIAAEHRAPRVVGIEPSATYLGSAVKSDPAVGYFQLNVDPEHADILRDIIRTIKVTLVVARRVFPEIGERNPAWLPELARLFHEEGIEEICLEGRIPSSRATNPFPTADHEVSALSSHFALVASHRNCRLLKRI